MKAEDKIEKLEKALDEAISIIILYYENLNEYGYLEKVSEEKKDNLKRWLMGDYEC